MVSIERVFLVPDEDVPETFLGRIQWKLFQSLRRPVVITRPLSFEETEGEPLPADEERLAAYLRTFLGNVHEPSAEMVVFVLNRPGFIDRLGFVVRLNPRTQCVVVPMATLPVPGPAEKAILHTVGHAYGLPGCGNSDCAMSFWDGVSSRGGETAEWNFCAACRQRLRNKEVSHHEHDER